MPKSTLVTVPAVEIVKVGEWPAHTTDGKPWTVTADDIESAVAAARNATWRKPVVKLGHTDDRFTEGEDVWSRDGTPAVGRLTNLRASADGLTLLADLTGVPAWLAEVMPHAYPSRSPEAILGATARDGSTYSMVITGLALLGDTLPAIESLADVAAMFGADTDVTTWVAARRVAATFNPTEPNVTTKVAASARIEDLYKAVEAWAKGSDVIPSEVYPREIYTDYVILCDWDGRLWQTSWTEANGEFSFGDASRVQVTYTPMADSVAAAAAHNMAHALRYERGWDSGKITASLGETSVSIAPAVREALGMDESADEDAVNAALLERLKTPAVVSTPQTQEPAAVATTAVPVAQTSHDQSDQGASLVADLDQRISAAVSAAMTTGNAELTRVSAELAAIKQAEVTKAREATIARAISAGKIRPADRERFTALYDAAPAQTVDMLDALAPGTAVPVSASGYAGDGDTASTEVDKLLTDMGFGGNL